MFSRMKLRICRPIIATTLFIPLAMAVRIFAQDQPASQESNSEHGRYTVMDLGPVGGPPGQAYVVSQTGLVAGGATTQDGALHAVLWYGRLKIDIGNPGLGGPNSVAFGVSETGVAGTAQTSESNAEDFCGFNTYGLPPSSTSCRPFVLRGGVVTALPTLGGANGVANVINNRGVAVGWAETDVKESNCSVSAFKPVVWKNGKAHALPTFKGDGVGEAAWINDKGQVVGSSGSCGPFNPNTGLYMVQNHALLWEDGRVINLGNLGGTGGIAGNHACAINNRGEIVGHSELANDTTFHAFLWTKDKHKMEDLGTAPGDYASLGLGINDRGTIVGASLDTSFTPRAVIWNQGSIADLNTVIHGSSNLHLLLASSINDRGEIAGLAITEKGEPHGFLAIPWNDHDRDY